MHPNAFQTLPPLPSKRPPLPSGWGANVPRLVGMSATFISNPGASLNYSKPMTTIPSGANVVDLTTSRSATPEVVPSMAPVAAPIPAPDSRVTWPVLNPPRPMTDSGQTGGRTSSFSGDKPFMGEREKRNLSSPPTNGAGNSSASASPTINALLNPTVEPEKPQPSPPQPPPQQLEKVTQGNKVDVFSMESQES